MLPWPELVTVAYVKPVTLMHPASCTLVAAPAFFIIVPPVFGYFPPRKTQPINTTKAPDSTLTQTGPLGWLVLSNMHDLKITVLFKGVVLAFTTTSGLDSPLK